MYPTIVLSRIFAVVENICWRGKQPPGVSGRTALAPKIERISAGRLLPWFPALADQTALSISAAHLTRTIFVLFYTTLMSSQLQTKCSIVIYLHKFVRFG